MNQFHAVLAIFDQLGAPLLLPIMPLFVTMFQGQLLFILLVTLAVIHLINKKTTLSDGIKKLLTLLLIAFMIFFIFKYLL